MKKGSSNYSVPTKFPFVTEVADQLSYVSLKKGRLSSEQLFQNTEHVLYVIDTLENNNEIEKDLRYLSRRYGATRIVILALNCSIPESFHCKDITICELHGKELDRRSSHFVKVENEIAEHCTTIAIFRVKDNEKAIRQIRPLYSVEVRIAFGDELSYPLRNIALRDPQSTVEDYF